MIYYLSGVARSGSTVLAAILNQNPDIYVSNTSPLLFLVEAVQNDMANKKIFEISSFSSKKFFTNVCNGIAKGMYSDIDKKIIIDKGRSWTHPKLFQALVDMHGGPENVKIITTLRDVADCMASYTRVTKKDINEILNNVKGRHLKTTIVTCYDSICNSYFMYPQCFHFVEYENLLKSPEQEIKKIHDFLGIPYFNYDFKNIRPVNEEYDEDKVWEIPDLHKVSPVLTRQHKSKSKDVLRSFYYQFIYPEFWKQTDSIKEYENKIKRNPMYKVVRFIEDGNLKAAKSKINLLHKKYPDDPIYNYFKSYFLFKDGNIKQATPHLHVAREYNFIFEKPEQQPSKPYWDGKRVETVLVILEGEEESQIYYARYIPKLIKKGCKIIVVCSDKIQQLLNNLVGDPLVVNKAVIDKIILSKTTAIKFDSIVFSSFLPLFFNDDDANYSGPYIKTLQPLLAPKTQKTIGVYIESNMRNFLTRNLYTYLYPLLPSPINNILTKYIPDNVLDKSKILSLLDSCKLEYTDLTVLQNLNDKHKADITYHDIILTNNSHICHVAGALGKQVWYISPYFTTLFLSSDIFKPYDMKIFRQENNKSWANVYKKLETEIKAFLQ